jgi:glycosyltransferase involved in cell wall biosynthesis
MRIALPGRILDRHVGGNTTYATEIARRMPDFGHVVTTLPWAAHPALTAGQEIFAARTWGPRRADVVHFTADTGPALGCRLPLVVTAHGVASRHTSVARTRTQETVWRARVRAAVHQASLVLSVSHSAADDVAAVFGIDPASILVIPHGIDHLANHGGELSPRVERLLASTEPFMLYLGNIEPRKNVDNLVRAVTEDGGVGMRLVVAGKPAWNFTPTLELMAQRPEVEYLGFVTDADRAALLAGCRLFVFPSHYEGFGFPVLEAMSKGAAVICSNEGFLAEVAGPALRLPGLDPGSIREGLRTALSDGPTLSAVAAAGPAWAAQFTWEVSARRHAAAYESVLGS